MKQLKITVITINYNNLTGLKKTFESVFEQTFQDFEYIVIDGGSSDGSKKLLESHSDKFAYWVSEPDEGIYGAMNKGVARATGDYVIHMNSGDMFYSSQTLENVVSSFNSGEDIICGNSYFINDNRLGSDYIWKAPKKANFSFFRKDTLNHQSVFIKRELFDRVGFYEESFKAASDWAFFLKAFSFHHAKYKHIDLIVSKYDRSGFSSQNWQVGAKEQLEVFRKEFSFFYDEHGDQDIIFFSPYLKNFKRNLKRLIKIFLPYGLIRFREVRNAKLIQEKIK